MPPSPAGPDTAIHPQARDNTDIFFTTADSTKRPPARFASSQHWDGIFGCRNWRPNVGTGSPDVETGVPTLGRRKFVIENLYFEEYTLIG
jgi:hypothetical protein